MPVDPMDDIELRSVQLQFPHARGSIVDSCDQRRVTTDKGEILVAIQGDTSKPAILTYHDLGLNCRFSWKVRYVSYTLILIISFLRRHKFCRFFQFSLNARSIGKFLCLSCDCSRTRRRRTNFA